MRESIWSIGSTGAGKGLVILLSRGFEGILSVLSQCLALLDKLIVRDLMECQPCDGADRPVLRP